VELVSHAAKQVQPGGQGRGDGHYKVGTPYQIDGIWYYPAVDYDYSETGIASWYGPQFHGNPTANGEIFNQYDISAAHRTLPLPSMVRVTNLENGRSLTCPAWCE
jgi:rare lipoprotein A